MSELAVRIAELGKKFELGRIGSGSLRETLEGIFTWWRKKSPESEANTKEFWALRDINLDIHRGDVIGIVGKNGAGKSTLLKILSRITEPTAGRIELFGRVASLLEVGTGFHPELTGRENVYLNGSILGMKRAEIRRKFDEIVEFSGVGKFLDTPVKRYSSGMYVRLAFAVAAHLEAEILVVDEVLAVGDAEFQRKCLGKMGEVAQSGRTVLFVSHNMGAVKSLCNKACLLADGQLMGVGEVDTIIREYAERNTGSAGFGHCVFPKPKGLPLWAKALYVRANGATSEAIYVGDELSFDIHFESESPVRAVVMGAVISSASYGNVLNINNDYQPNVYLDEPTQSGVLRCHLGRVPLMPGQYFVSLWTGASLNDMHIVSDCLVLEVLEKDIWGMGKRPPRMTPLYWNTRFELLPEQTTL